VRHDEPAQGRAPAGSERPFAVHLDLRDGRLAVTGRLSRRSSHLLRDAVSAMLDAHRRCWLVEIAEADLGGDAGLQAIGAAYRRLLRGGHGMTLVGADPALCQRLVRARLDRHVLAPPDPFPGSRNSVSDL
jgi:anti-anti-sigma regulatory factor